MIINAALAYLVAQGINVSPLEPDENMGQIRCPGQVQRWDIEDVW